MRKAVRFQEAPYPHHYSNQENGKGTWKYYVAGVPRTGILTQVWHPGCPGDVAPRNPSMRFGYL